MARKLLCFLALTSLLWSCASTSKMVETETKSSRELTSTSANANDYGAMIACRIKSTPTERSSVGFDRWGDYWHIYFSDCKGINGDKYEVTLIQNRKINLDFLKDKNGIFDGVMTIFCMGKEVVGDYNYGHGVGLAYFVFNAEYKFFISTENAAMCAVPSASFGLTAGVEWSPYMMTIKKLN